MKQGTLIFLIFLLSSCLHLAGQGRGQFYSYDANGNRTCREIVIEQLMPLEFPVTTPEEFKPIKVEQEFFMKVFPNPTRGKIKIELSGFEVGFRSKYFVYNLNGNLLLTKAINSNEMEVDLTGLRDGVYVLRIRMEKEVYDWKIIKSGYR
ncbi:MAG: T9SS type A sorting domain-containing protein [Bacteroidales bacterium]